MKKLVFAAVVGLTPALVGTSALADGMGGSTYVGISGVAAMVNDIEGSHRRAGSGVLNKREAEMDPSYGVLVRAGKKFDMFRAELELGYRDFQVDDITSTAGSVSNPSGDATAYSLMVNGIYDIETDGAVTPYVMVGVGAMNIDGDIRYTTDDGGETEKHSADGTTVAGQIGLGVSYEISSNVDLVAGYSFLAAPTDETGEDEIIQMHSAQIGLNYSF